MIDRIPHNDHRCVETSHGTCHLSSDCVPQDDEKNFDGAQYFDRTCINFFAPAGGGILPERMSVAATGLP